MLSVLLAPISLALALATTPYLGNAPGCGLPCPGCPARAALSACCSFGSVLGHFLTVARASGCPACCPVVYPPTPAVSLPAPAATMPAVRHYVVRLKVLGDQTVAAPVLLVPERTTASFMLPASPPQGRAVYLRVLPRDGDRVRVRVGLEEGRPAHTERHQSSRTITLGHASTFVLRKDQPGVKGTRVRVQVEEVRGDVGCCPKGCHSVPVASVPALVPPVPAPLPLPHLVPPLPVLPSHPVVQTATGVGPFSVPPGLVRCTAVAPTARGPHAVLRAIQLHGEDWVEEVPEPGQDYRCAFKERIMELPGCGPIRFSVSGKKVVVLGSGLEAQADQVAVERSGRMILKRADLCYQVDGSNIKMIAERVVIDLKRQRPEVDPAHRTKARD